MGPLFASAVSALRCALNHRDDSMKPAAPIMNTMLYAAQHRKESKGVPIVRRHTPLNELTKLEKTLQAGIILRFLASLPDHLSQTLVATYRSPYVVCNCSSPCCSGYKKDADWKHALAMLASILNTKAEYEREVGHKGFKTSPPLMKRVLTRIFDPKARLSQLDIAEVCGVTPATVAAHGKHLGAILDDWRKDGLTAMDAILVEEGIVGAIE